MAAFTGGHLLCACFCTVVTLREWLRMPRVFRLPSASAVLLLATGCGYHTLGSAAHIPEDVHTIVVPFFDNRTQFSHTEVALTQATVHELNTRTKFRVLPREDAGDADAVLKGTVSAKVLFPIPTA